MDRELITTFKPRLHPEAVQNAMEVLGGTWIGTGPVVVELESRLADRLGVKFPLCVSSGTAALELALSVLGIGSNNGGGATDEVITTPLTFIATNNSILRAGAVPVFVDIEPGYTYNIDPQSIKGCITRNTKAVTVVHMYGHPCDMDEINKLGIPVIEDCAHAFDAEYKGMKIGSEDNNIHCYSFQAVKSFTTAGGGMISLPSEWMWEKARKLRWFGVDRNSPSRAVNGTYNLDYIGGKFNMTDINAAIGLGQLEHIDEDNEYRRELVAAYEVHLPEEVTLPTVEDYATHAWHAYTIWDDSRNSHRNPVGVRNELIGYLRDHQVQTMILYRPHYMYSQYPGTVLPICDRMYKGMLTLPLHMHLAREDVLYICDCITNFYRCGQ